MWNVSVRILWKIFLKENFWQVIELWQGSAKWELGAQLSPTLSILTAICSFVNLSFWSEVICFCLCLYLLLWGLCEGVCVVGRLGLLIKKSIVSVLAARWMCQHAECGLQTCGVGEHQSRSHLLVTLLCQQPQWIAPICNNQVEAGFSASSVLAAEEWLLWLITSDAIVLLASTSFLT